jgi:subfamily B ATP-binding cassette protein MsbA
MKGQMLEYILSKIKIERKFKVERKAYFSTLKKLLKFFKPYWNKCIIAFLFMLLNVALQLPMPFLTQYLIDHVIISKSFKALNIIVFFLFCALFLRAGSIFIQSFMLTIFRARILFDIRVKLFEHVQKQSLLFFHRNPTGYIMSRISGDVNPLQGLLGEILLSLAYNSLTFVVGIICTLYIHIKLALISFTILPFYLFSLHIFKSRIKKTAHEVREKYALVEKDLQELISGISIIKAFTGEIRSTIRYINSLKSAIKKGVELDILSTLASISSVVISSISPIIIIWYGCSEIMKGNFTIGGLIAFNYFTRYLFTPAHSLFESIINIQKSMAAIERIFEILELPLEKDGVKEIEIKEGEIVFENVSFSYDGREKVLENVSFKVKKGEKVAIVGKTGVGKSTLVSLILRFYEPQSGRILIDNQDIKYAKLRSLRKYISIVSQNDFLFSDTIRENIRFGNPNVLDEEVEKAAKLAYADEFIKKLPKGYETKIGERGINLSGGERQRISIARAILKNPKILILDEATSAVDSETENKIQKALEDLMRGRVTLIIAHRLSTILNADKILVFENGKIVGEGTHEELYKNNEIYRKLFDQQFIDKNNLS